MRLYPSPTPLPLNIYRSDQIISTTIASALRKSFDTAPHNFPSTLDNFPKESHPSRYLAHKFKHFYQKPFIHPTTNKYIIHHVDDADDEDESHEESLFSIFNPFGCESEYSDDEDDENEILGASSNELFSDRKFLKLLKWKKLKKKKKKKKLLLFKLLLGILAFLAVKFLLKKAYSFFPAILAFVRRDELYHDGDIELDRDIDFIKTSTTDENYVAEHRSLFPLTYEVQHKLIL